MLIDSGVEPDAVLALGVSPAAARSLRRQLAETWEGHSREGGGSAQLGGSRSRGEELAPPAVDTLGSFCVGLLREAATEARLDPHFALASDVDRLALLQEQFGEPRPGLPGGRPGGLTLGALVRAIRQIDLLKGALVDADRYAEWASRSGEERARQGPGLATLYGEHERLLAAQPALDHGDLVLRAGALLAEEAPVRGRLAARYRHVLIDGLELVSPAVALLLRRLTDEIPDVALALDEAALAGFSRDWPMAEVVSLKDSVAWAPSIARAARAAEAAEAVAGWPSEPAHPNEGAAVSFWKCTDERAMAQDVVADIERLLTHFQGAQEPPDRHGSIGVIVRSLATEGQAIAGALKERALRARVHAPNAFLDSAEVRDVLAWLRLLADPLDVNATVRLLGRAPVALRPVEIARVNQLARRRKLDMISALAQASQSAELPPEACERIVSFLGMHGELVNATQSMRADQLVHHIIERTGLGRARILAEDDEALEAAASLVRLEELASHLRTFWPHAGPREIAGYLTAAADAGLPLVCADDESWAMRDVAGEPAEHPADAGAASERVVHVMSQAAGPGMAFDHVYLLGLAGPTVSVDGPAAATAEKGTRVGGAGERVPPEVLAGRTPALGAFAAATRPWPHDDELRVSRALARARRRVVLAYAAEDCDRVARVPMAPVERARQALGAQWEERGPVPRTPSTDLDAAIRTARRRVMEDVERIGGRLGELRLDTDYDISQGVVSYLELLKLAALAGRPGERGLAEALPDINSRLLGACTPLERDLFEASGLDRALHGGSAAGRSIPGGGPAGSGLAGDDGARSGGGRSSLGGVGDDSLLASLLPRHGEGLALSASDVEVYRSCPLRYKFTRLLRIPTEPTPQQRFGIVIHQVLERYHAGDPGEAKPTREADAARGRKAMSRLLESAWRRAGFYEGPRESEFFEKARAALIEYQRQLADQEGRPVWFERSFSFPVGRHLVRGRVDRIDRLPDGEYELLDYKTGYPKTLAQLEGEVQLSLYSLAARRAWRLEASRLSYYYVLDNCKVTLPERADGGRLERITETICEAAEGILDLRFEPRPSFAVCSSCDYLSICPAAES
jgi:DNA helicase-2/ATP-dependent DNA helicase PcrA